MSLNDWLKAGGGVVLLFMTLVQIAPIKVNPWSAIGKLAGNLRGGKYRHRGL